MTKKDYELIANAIREELQDTSHYAAVLFTANRIAKALATDNPRFDPVRFRAACVGD